MNGRGRNLSLLLFVCAAVAQQAFSISQNAIFVAGSTTGSIIGTANASTSSIGASLSGGSRDESTTSSVLDDLNQEDTWFGTTRTSTFNRDIESNTESNLWPKAEVPYSLNLTMRPGYEEVLNQSIEEFHLYTCIRFRRMETGDVDYLLIANGKGCGSIVGRLGGRQNLILSPSCYEKKFIIHELGHSIGFVYQHNRPDRDEYVTIRFENIRTNFREDFKKYNADFVNFYGIPYDYLSIMHYGQYVASANGNTTIETRDDSYQKLIGKRTSLSFRDAKLANMMYKCSEVNGCRNLTCPGEGFVGQDCQCWCPSLNSNLTAEHCAVHKDVHRSTNIMGSGGIFDGQEFRCRCLPQNSNMTYERRAGVDGCKNMTHSGREFVGLVCNRICYSGNNNRTAELCADVNGCDNVTRFGAGCVSLANSYWCPSGSSNIIAGPSADINGCKAMTCPGGECVVLSCRCLCPSENSNRTQEPRADVNEYETSIFSQEQPVEYYCRCLCRFGNRNETSEHGEGELADVQLSIGHIAAIVVGSLVSLSALVTIAIFFVHRRKQLGQKNSSPQLPAAENEVAETRVQATEYCSLDQQPTVLTYTVLSTEEPIYNTLQPYADPVTYLELQLYDDTLH